MPFKATLFTRGNQSHSYEKEMAMAAGMRKHGVTIDLKSWQDSHSTDLAVMWGVRNKRLINDVKANNSDFLVLENGYIGNRNNWVSCGFNGLNGHADFVTDNVGNDRLSLISNFVLPLREGVGKYVLIMGQVPSDASVRHIGFNKWLDGICNKLKGKCDIVYRPHPLNTNAYIPDGVKKAKGGLLCNINDASCVVTLNSNSGVDTVLAGVPCVAMDKGSMAWEVTGHNIEDILEPNYYERTQWLNKMSYAQWSIREMQAGDAWDHLKGFYPKRRLCVYRDNTSC